MPLEQPSEEGGKCLQAVLSSDAGHTLGSMAGNALTCLISKSCSRPPYTSPITPPVDLVPCWAWQKPLWRRCLDSQKFVFKSHPWSLHSATQLIYPPNTCLVGIYHSQVLGWTVWMQRKRTYRTDLWGRQTVNRKDA